MDVENVPLGCGEGRYDLDGEKKLRLEADSALRFERADVLFES